VLLLASPALAGWYFTVSPPHGAPFDVGPWSSDSDCADTLGSALYSHPYGCHLGWQPAKHWCRITGNGFLYPKDATFPIPADYPIQVTNCFKAKKSEVTSEKAGWYFFFYSETDGSVRGCNRYKKSKALADTNLGDEIGYYHDMACPGAPCFSIGSDTACN
jgi:hypothetical protein